MSGGILLGVFTTQSKKNTNLRLMSLNANGLSAHKKISGFASRYLFGHFGSLCDIFCLQETHSTKEIEKSLLQQWQHHLIFGHNSSASGGLIIGVNRSLNFENLNVFHRQEEAGQALLLHAKIKGIELVLINIYVNPRGTRATKAAFAPFLDKVQTDAEQWGCPNVIWCGDFNSVIDPQLDSTNPERLGAAINRSGVFADFVEKMELVDTYRVLNPTSHRVTHFSGVGKTGKRLDYILTSGYFLNMIKEVSILTCNGSDHNPVVLELMLDRNPKGRGHWRFPDPLLKNPEFVSFMKGKIADSVRNARGVNQATIWDYVKMNIRNETIRFLQYDRESDKREHEKFQGKLAGLYFRRDSSEKSEVDALQEQIKRTTQEWEAFLTKLDKKRIEINLGRKRQEDQKSSKYFFRRYNAIPGSSTFMYDKNGNELSTDKQMLELCHEFYTGLYNKSSNPVDSPYAFIPENSPTILENDDKEILGAPVTIVELHAALKGMKNGKAPGMDGLTVAFITDFWKEVGPLIHGSLMHAQRIEELSPTQKRGVVKLLPKKDKNPAWVRNLRPITLLNVDLKILTRALALRLKTVIHNLINKDQQAFVYGRYLGNSLLDLYAIAVHAVDTDKNILAISLDIEKAFDSVNWDFLYRLLHAYGFPEQFVQWIKIMHNGKELRIFNNGHSSPPVNVSNGLAQGCSLSPLLFIICIESLARVIRDNDQIEGVSIENAEWGKKEKKVGMVADDTMVTIKANANSFTETVTVLKAFERSSGLKVNYEKSIICRLGSNNETNLTTTTDCNFVWLQKGQTFTYLGTKLSVNPQGHITGQGNFEFSTADMDRILSQLRFGENSMLGRVLLIKSLFASRFVYKMSLLPVPNKFLQAATRYFRSVLWNHHRPRIAGDTMQMEIEKGGFKMLNVFLQNKSLKFQWLHRALNTETEHFWQIQLHNVVKIPVRELLNCNLNSVGWRNLFKNTKAISPFWEDVLKLWYSTNFIPGTRKTLDASRILQMPLCFNSAVTWNRDDIMEVYEQLNALEVTTIEQFLRKKDALQDNEAIQWFRRRVPTQWLFIDVNSDLEQTLYTGVVKQKWTPKLVYNFLLNAIQYIPKAIGSWSRELTNPLSQDLWAAAGRAVMRIHDVRSRSFQLMIMNRGYYVNNTLAKFMDISPMCTFCNTVEETYTHLYWSCEKVTPLIQALKLYCSDTLGLNLNLFTRETFLLSVFEETEMVMITTLVKKFVFHCRIEKKQPVFKECMCAIRNFVRKDKCRAKYAKNLQMFYQTWGALAEDEVLKEIDCL